LSYHLHIIYILLTMMHGAVVVVIVW